MNRDDIEEAVAIFAVACAAILLGWSITAMVVL